MSQAVTADGLFMEYKGARGFHKYQPAVINYYIQYPNISGRKEYIMKNFLFLGGDLRAVYAAEELNKTYDCFAYGFELSSVRMNIRLLREPAPCGNLVLPLPACADGENINAPYSEKKIPFTVLPSLLKENGTVYAGKATDELRAFCAEHSMKLVDYLEREEFIVMNAVPTAEGALEIAVRERQTTIMSSKVVITGFGRVAKVLVRYFTALGADVIIAARKAQDLAWAEIMGCRSVPVSDMKEAVISADIIINTVPAPIFSRELSSLIRKDCLFIEVASVSGLSDYESAKAQGIKIVNAQGLPGKIAPVTAGKAIADTIRNIITESEVDGDE